MTKDDKILATLMVIGVIFALAVVTLAISTDTPLLYECGVNTYC